MVFKRYYKRAQTWLWVVRLEHEGIKYQSVGGRSKKEALKQYSQAKAAIKLGTWESPAEKRAQVREEVEQRQAERKDAGPTFAALVTAFVKSKGKQRSRHYQVNLGSALKRFGPRRAKSITSAQVNTWMQERRDKDGCGPSTIRKNVTALSSVFIYAKKHDILVANPVDGVERPPEPEAKKRTLSFAEYRTLVEGAREQVPWLEPLLRWSLLTGCRLKEATVLRYKDLDAASALWHLSEDNKTGRPRQVPLSQAALAMVAAQGETGRFDKDRHVFLREGNPLDSENARLMVSCTTLRLAARLKLDGVSFATLRKTAATWCGKSSRILKLHVPKESVAQVWHGTRRREQIDSYYLVGADETRVVAWALEALETLALGGSAADEEGRPDVLPMNEEASTQD